MNANKMKNLLIDLGVSKESSIESYYPNVRDRDDIEVFKCKDSGVIFLDTATHISEAYYNAKDEYTSEAKNSRQYLLNQLDEDIQRRVSDIKYIVSNKKWLDVGSGSGGVLDMLQGIAREIISVEPQDTTRKDLQNLGYKVYPSLYDIKEKDIDVISLFHVFEHLSTPIDDLIKLYETMKDGGRLIIEVPSANDLLLSFMELDEFKKFTLWSEHLILHTRHSLELFLKKAGFEDIIIKPVQRFPLANHMHWLKNGTPGGHIKWSQLRTTELDSAYEQMLASIDKTDTLVAYAVKIDKC